VSFTRSIVSRIRRCSSISMAIAALPSSTDIMIFPGSATAKHSRRKGAEVGGVSLGHHVTLA
jgi:hypothetical protein